MVMTLRNCSVLLATLVLGCSRQPRPSPQASALPADTQPIRLAFAIIFPKAGDTLIEGRTYIIRWHAPDSMTINLGAAMGGHDKGLLLDHAPARPDTLVWSIPVGYVTGFGPASSDVMRLRLENAANPDQYTEAGPFTIRGSVK